MLSYLLGSIREYLDMDVAFISEFLRGRRVFRYVDSRVEPGPIQEGDSNTLEESYCQRIVDGRLPWLINDTSRVPEASKLKATSVFGIGAYLGVPVHLDDGHLYGTLCFYSHSPNPSLREREVFLLKLLSDFAGKELSRGVAPMRSREQAKSKIRSILSEQSFDLVYQPIFHLADHRTAGFEVLTRFSSGDYRSPDACFKEAASVGMGEEVEMLVLQKALENLDRFPRDMYLTLNSSPEHITSGVVERTLDGVPENRVLIEVTEHAYVPDYMALRKALARLKDRGVRFAVDDAGAGYASFNHILELKPDIIKLDMRLTRHIYRDSRRRALAAGLIGFANASGSLIVAEGVESVDELNTLRDLGVTEVQGYYIGRPMALADVKDYLSKHARF